MRLGIQYRHPYIGPQMKYLGNDKKPAQLSGVLLINLGTPDAPEPRALRRYLKQFLSDPRIVEMSRAVWWLILNGIILNIRPRLSAAAYRKVWTDRGSPLLFHSTDLTAGIETALNDHNSGKTLVRLGMSYGSPAIDDVIESMLSQGVGDLIVLPLYPQYSGTTSGSTFDAVAANFSRRRRIPKLTFINNYYDHPAYITSLADSIREHWATHQRADKLIFSFHGEPKRYVDQGDPYQHECEETSRLLAQELQLETGEYMTAYQSRFGREEWLRPYLDQILKTFPGQGVKTVQIICPGFAVDCLETLEEIAMENREYFMQAGGERYEYISCLNASDRHVQALASVIRAHLPSG